MNAAQKKRGRYRTVVAAKLALHNASQVHYTQGPARWSGISEHKRAFRKQFPHYADCSAFVTWCFWDGTLRYKPRDFVNGSLWREGYTGTMAEHGHNVTGQKWIAGADAALYGPGPTYEHTALYVGNGMVISFGSEAGPFLLPVHYRSDFAQMRRYL